jgi:hypothetical protein
MSSHGRKYGEKASHVIPVWNGILEHREKIGSAIWEFLWCVDRVTVEKNGVGFVLGGQPVKIKRISDEVPGSDIETVRLHLESLEREKYIRRLRTPYGYKIEVLNSRKFGIWKKPENTVSRLQEKPQNPGRDTRKDGQRNPKTGVCKEDSAVTQQRHSIPNSTFSQDPSIVVLPKEGKKNGWHNRDEERERRQDDALERILPRTQRLAKNSIGHVPTKQLTN